MADFDEHDVQDLAAWLNDQSFGGNAYGTELWENVEPGSEAYVLAARDAEELARRIVPVISSRARANLIRELRAAEFPAEAEIAERINEGMLRDEKRTRPEPPGR